MQSSVGAITIWLPGMRSRGARNEIPSVLWVESTGNDQRSNDRAIELMKSRFMRGCSAFVVPGKSSFEYVRGYGAAPEDIFTAPNAVDIDLFAGRAAEVRKHSSTYRQALRLPFAFFSDSSAVGYRKGSVRLARRIWQTTCRPSTGDRTGVCWRGSGALGAGGSIGGHAPERSCTQASPSARSWRLTMHCARCWFSQPIRSLGIGRE